MYSEQMENLFCFRGVCCHRVVLVVESASKGCLEICLQAQSLDTRCTYGVVYKMNFYNILYIVIVHIINSCIGLLCRLIIVLVLYSSVVDI